MILLFANNAKTTLAAGISSVDATLTVFPGTGIEFPSPSATQYFKLTLVDALTGLVNEIMHVTNVTSDTFTVIRAQEGTTAQSWLAGDSAANFDTAGTEGLFLQPDQIQEGTYGYAVAGGTVNAITVTVPSDLTTLPDGMPLVVKSIGANTSAVTILVTLGSTVLTLRSIVKGGNQSLLGGDIPSLGYPIVLNWSAAYTNWVMQNPAMGASVIPVGSIFMFPSVSAPTGFLLANGQLLARATYPSLYAFAVSSGNIVSDTAWNAGQYGSFSAGDGTTTFRLPQFGGYFLRPLDNGNGIDPSRAIGTIQGSQNIAHNHTASSTSNSSSGSVVTDPNHLHSEGVHLPPNFNGSSSAQAISNGGTQFSGGGASNLGFGGGTPYGTNAAATGITVATTTTTITSTTVNNSGGSEARPINISVLTCIKY